jgi:hypothetical protein
MLIWTHSSLFKKQIMLVYTPFLLLLALVSGRAPPGVHPAARHQRKQMVHTPFPLLLALVSGRAPSGVNPAARHQKKLVFRRNVVAVADVSFANLTLANLSLVVTSFTPIATMRQGKS